MTDSNAQPGGGQDNELPHWLKIVEAAATIVAAVIALVQGILLPGPIQPIGVIVLVMVLIIALVALGAWKREIVFLALFSVAGLAIIAWSVLSQPAVVTGRILEDNGSPIQGLAVTLNDASGVDHTAVTDDSGAFEIRLVPAGEFTIRAGHLLLMGGEIATGWRRVFPSSKVILGDIGYRLPVDSTAQDGTADTTEEDLESDNLYDDFNNLSFEGTFDTNRWMGTICPEIFEVFQEAGALIFRNRALDDHQTCLLQVSPPTTVSAYDLGTLEARVMLSQEGYNNFRVNQGVQFRTTDLPGDPLHAFCGLYANQTDGSGVEGVFDISYRGDETHTEFFNKVPVEFNRWYTLRLELHPDEMVFSCYLDGVLLGSFTPSGADALRSAQYSRELNSYRSPGSVAVTYVDDVRAFPER